MTLPATPEQRWQVGHAQLGPVFAAFAQLLDASARRDGVRHLVFVARDGEFLRTVQQCWQQERGVADPLRLHYAYLSRRSTQLLRPARIDAAAVQTALAVRAGVPSATSLLRFLGVDLAALPPALQSQVAVCAPQDLAALAATPAFQTALTAQRDQLVAQMRRYLATWGLPGATDVAFVDIGWQGSIVRTLQQALCGPGERLRLYQMGHWGEALPLPDTPARIEGLLGDWQRGRRLREGAVYQLALLLEAVCRENAPPVAGYAGLDPVLPRWAEDTHDAEAERLNDQWREPLRAGVLQAVAEAARSSEVGDPRALRRQAQRRLMRLAWFPAAAARAAAEGLRHAEGHAAGWSVPLISPQRPRPWRSPRAWVAGLASPWRSGYLMATGGWPVAALYAVLEALLLATPPSWRQRLQRLARRFGGID